MLETSGYDDPPDLRSSCEVVAASTGHPVLAVYISDDSCAAMVAAIPGRAGPLTHLWPENETCGRYRHQPRDMPEPAGRSLDVVVGELTAWSAAAGLQADVSRLRQLIGRDPDQTHGQIVDLLFETVKALGVRRIGRTFPWSLPAFDWPFSSVMFSLGPAAQARQNAKYRAAGVKCITPVQPWETAALALETELWGSLYRPNVEVAALAHRAACLLAAYRAASDEETIAPETTDPPVLDEISLELLARLESRLAEGTMSPGSEEIEERHHADAWATEPE
ncbi:hypothetical protein [Actinoplanes regularis]|uniref:hypothetical protein n=1 Tax=Actinoplanes regularis TaxID=52697 RepID=UPI0025560B50|nr:hypothetical protein [Actinoplanes regularis]